MRVSRTIPVLLLAAATLAACNAPSEQETVAADMFRADSLSYLRSELAEQAMQAAMFVNEVNKELAKARSMPQPKQLQTTSELVEVNEERKQAVARVTQLVERLDVAQGRLAGLRRQLADKDSALSSRIAEYEQMLADANQAAERQRAELQVVIDQQTTKIASLVKQVDTLAGTVGQLEAEQNAVFFVVGTREELIDKGILVAEGPKRFLLVGSRTLVPARELDPGHFTRLDRRSDSTIFLPDGVYKIVSRQNGAHAAPEVEKDGKIAGALKIEDPERFWSTSRFLILVRS